MRKNPLTMLGTLERCWLFAYQTPVAEARALLPPELEPVTRGECAFWSVVVSRVRKMRPWPLPPLLGVSYWHVGYRLYARFRPAGGEPVEGLYFLRSDCDSRLMAVMGNWLTDYNFHVAGIHIVETEQARRMEIVSPDAAARATVDVSAPPELPAHSAFGTLEEAGAFLKYKPRGLSVSAPGRVNVVQIAREEAAWKSRLVRVETAQWDFFKGKTVRPEICYEVEPIDYRWHRGRLHKSEGRLL